MSSVIVHRGRSTSKTNFTLQVRQYPMSKYELKFDEQGKAYSAPSHHKVNMDGYLHSYLHNPALYLLSVPRARLMMETYCSAEETQEVKLSKSCGGQREATLKTPSNVKDGQTNTQKVKKKISIPI